MNLKKEIPILIFVLIPFVYLVFIWNSLPETVPIHWNKNGEIDGWGDKSTLIWIPFMMSGLVYLVFSVVPLIDPKKKLQAMGNKFYNLKFLMVVFMSGLTMFILYSVKKQSLGNPSIIFLAIGLLYIILGNYMKTIKPNYFIGVRTPWTLENEDIWKSTHKLAGKLCFFGGLAVVVSSLLTTNDFNFIFFIVVSLIISLIPLAYSYIEYKKLEN